MTEDRIPETRKEYVNPNLPRRSDGTLLPGHGSLNPGGVSKDQRTAQKKLHEALTLVEGSKGISFLQHYIEEAWDDRTMAIALLKKIVPDLKAMELNTEAKQNLNIILQSFAEKEMQESNERVDVINESD